MKPFIKPVTGHKERLLIRHQPGQGSMSCCCGQVEAEVHLRTPPEGVCHLSPGTCSQHQQPQRSMFTGESFRHLELNQNLPRDEAQVEFALHLDDKLPKPAHPLNF